MNNKMNNKMNPKLEQAADEGDVTVFDRIERGELSLTDSDFLSIGEWGYNFVHLAASRKHDQFICKAFTDVIKPEIRLKLLLHKNGSGANLLHSAAWFGCREATEVLIKFYNSLVQNGQVFTAQPPWKVANKHGKTPLHDALENGNDDIACYLLSIDPFYLYDKVDFQRRSPLFLAVDKGCTQVIEQILSPELDLSVTSASFSGPEGRTALHQAIINMLEESLVRRLLAKLDKETDITWKKDSRGWTALHYATEAGVHWQIELLLRRPPSSNLFMFDPNSESPLILAWKSCDSSTFQTILRCYPAMVQWLGKNNTTLLHHIKLQSLEVYQQIFQLPETQQILNIKDNNGMTPLHQAICDGNFVLTELLFQMDSVDRAIRNNDRKTPMHLLLEKSHQSQRFAELCKRLETSASYIPYVEDMKEVRSTLMVVAALLATITFQAAFTIPDATVKRTPLFVIFLIADTLALCCSLVVLFWLIWAMVEDDFEKSRKLADRIVFVLMLSFYGTLVAFAVAVFVIACEKSLFLAMAVTIVCSFVPLLSSRMIASKFFKVEGRLRLLWSSCSRYKLMRELYPKF